MTTATRATLEYLESVSPVGNRLVRAAALGAAAQRSAWSRARFPPLRREGGARRASFFGSPMPPHLAVPA